MNPTVPNPFDSTTPAFGPRFFGREDELNWILSGVERCAKLLLHGPSGIGKSSLAAEAAARLGQKAGASNALGLDLSRYTDLPGLIQGMRDGALPLMSSGAADPGEVFGDLATRAAGAAMPALDEGAAAMGPVAVLALLDRLNLHARTRGSPTLVVIEHYEQLPKFGAPVLEEGLRGALVGHRSLCYVITGEERAIKELAAKVPGGTSQGVETRRLGPPPPHAFARWIEEQFQKANVVAPGVGSACVDNAGPRTRDIVNLAEKTFTLSVTTRFANRATVESAMEQSISEKAPGFVEKWGRLSAPEKAVINALAAGKAKSLLGPDGYRVAGLRNDAELKQAMAGLQDKRIVESGSALDVRFSSPLFRGWAMQARMTWNRNAGEGMVGEPGPRFAFNMSLGRESRRAPSVAV